jgi:hypothetical protein
MDVEREAVDKLPISSQTLTRSCYEMATITTATTTQAPSLSIPAQNEKPVPPQLDPRFASLKKEIIKDVDPKVLKESWERLKIALAEEVERIDKLQQAAIPEVQWTDVQANGNRPSPV